MRRQCCCGASGVQAHGGAQFRGRHVAGGGAPLGRQAAPRQVTAVAGRRIRPRRRPPDWRHAGWTFKIESGQEGSDFKLNEARNSEALLLGRVTYQGFAKAWPSIGGEFGDKFNNMPKYVISSTLDRAEWKNSTVLKGDVVKEVSKLRQKPGGDIVVHVSAQLVQTLLEHDLVDEMRLMVYPVVLGSGKRLFGETSDRKPMRLVDSKTVGDGVTLLIFQPAPKKEA